MYTLGELHSKMTQLLDNSGDCECHVYGKEHLKQLLLDRYGNHIYFASRPGRDDVVGFSDCCDFILHSRYFADQSERDGSETEKLSVKLPDC
jgi:hypothetical protein